MTGGGGVRGDRGSATLELVALAPVLLALVLLTVGAGRLAAAGSTVQGAARDAARAASQQRTPGAAEVAARDTAVANLAGTGCTDPVVTVAFPPAGASVAVARVQVACTVALVELGLPGLGDRRLTRTVSAPVDTYRGRS